MRVIDLGRASAQQAHARERRSKSIVGAFWG
jgi:hypothetical protein